MWEVHSNDNYEYRQKICENFVICVRIGNFEKGTDYCKKRNITTNNGLVRFGYNIISKAYKLFIGLLLLAS